MGLQLKRMKAKSMGGDLILTIVVAKVLSVHFEEPLEVFLELQAFSTNIAEEIPLWFFKGTAR